MSSLFGLVVALIGVALKHGTRLLRGETTLPEPVIPSVRRKDRKGKKSSLFESFERLLIRAHVSWMLLLLVMLFGLVIFIAFNGSSGDQGLARATLIITAPGLLTFVVGRLLLESLIAKQYQRNREKAQ